MSKPREYKRRVCGRCPVWLRRWCYVFAKFMAAEHPACEYGAKKINSRDTAARARRRGISTQRRRGGVR